MASPSRRLRDALNGLAPPLTSFADALALFGGNKRALAGAIAGTDDRKSKAFKAAARNVERYARGERHPKTAMLAKIRAAGAPLARAATLARMRTDGVDVPWFAGIVAVSADERYREVSDVSIEPDMLAATGFFADARAGNWGQATDAFAAAWGSAYGIGYGVQWLDVDELDLEWP